MRIAPATRALVAVLGLVFLGVFGFLYYQANQVETAFVYASNLKPYTFISNAEEFLVPVSIPKNREFEAVTDPRQIVGKYVGPREVYAQTLVQDPQLVDELPSGQRSFPLSLLPVGTHAYPIDIPENIAGVFRDRDLIDVIVIIDEDENPSPDDRAVVLFQKVRSLGVVDEKFMVALNYDQIGAYEGWKSRPGIQFTAAINQDANPEYPPLYEMVLHPNYDSDQAARELFEVPTPTPEPDFEASN